MSGKSVTFAASNLKTDKDMPQLFTLFGLRFMFYSNDHEPIHVHVVKGGASPRREALLGGQDGAPPRRAVLLRGYSVSKNYIV